MGGRITSTGPGEAEVRDIGKYPKRPLHEYWIDTLREAAFTLPPPDDDALLNDHWVQVETQILVKHSSPGWLDGYRVKLSTGGS